MADEVPARDVDAAPIEGSEVVGEDRPSPKYPAPVIANDEPSLTPDVSQVVHAEVITEPVKRKPPSRVGQPGYGGRPKGSPNRITVEVKALARNLLEDKLYMRKLKADLRKRKVHPQMESVLWAYAYGKPVERMEVGRVGDFSKLSDEELMQQFEATVKSLQGQGRKFFRSA